MQANNHYFNDIATRMIYGPFDLENDVKAEISFWLWEEIEISYDYLKFEVSRDNVNFQPIGSWSGTIVWISGVFHWTSMLAIHRYGCLGFFIEIVVLFTMDHGSMISYCVNMCQD